MAQRFNDLFSPSLRESKGLRRVPRTLLLFLDTLSAIILLGKSSHAYYEFNTTKRSFIHVCLLITFFNLVFLFLAVWNQTIAAAGDCGIARL